MTRISSAFRYIYIALALSASTLALGGGLQTAKQTKLPSSVQETMLLIVDPSADTLWESVGTTVTKRGTQERRPSTPAEWLKLTRSAETLVAGARHLRTPGLPVGTNAHSHMGDADTPGARTAADIRSEIDADPARFFAAATVLETAANQALTAVRAHDADALFVAGDVIDAACENCHAAYWYPRAPLVPPSRR